MLDQAELRQLGLNASQAGDDGAAVAYFKEAASRPDADGSAHYILGAHYAQIKMYDRAADQMEAALALDPGLSIARLQLGLLWLTGGLAAKAIDTFAPLQELAEDEALRHFGQGLTQLAQDQLGAASAALARGIELNLVNPPLNTDMRMLIDKLALALAAPSAEAANREPLVENATSAEEGSAYRHLLQAAYGGSSSN